MTPPNENRRPGRVWMASVVQPVAAAPVCLRAGSPSRVPARTRSLLLAAALSLLWATAWVPPAEAQVAPSASETAAYRGLHAAAARGDAAAIRALAAAGGPAALEARDGNGRTPLHVATFARHGEAIRALAQAGAKLGALDHDRYDAVTIAAVADDEASLRTLLALGASARLVTSRYDGTALIAAAHLGHDGVVRQLIAAGAPLDHVNNLHWTAVIEAIVLGDGGPRHQATLKALVEAGANLQLADRHGRTPLQLARQRGYAAMAKMLEAAGAR
jgi:ankyrin repeat protein